MKMNYIRNIFVIIIGITMCLISASVVSAASQIPKEHMDSKAVEVVHADTLEKDSLGEIIITDEQKYLFTEKSAGCLIPLQVKEDGIVFYHFSSEKLELLNEKKQVISGEGDVETMRDVQAISVDKGKQYYIKMPDIIVEAEFEVYAYFYPRHINQLENGKTYMSMGIDKYVYYPFMISKKSLAALNVNCMYTYGDKILFKVQKKIGKKWKDITHVRTMKAYESNLGPVAPYALSKGKYRLGIKTTEYQMARIIVDIRKANNKVSLKKKKALLIKKGRPKSNVLTWEDRKAHWYKVVKKGNTIKKIILYAGCGRDKVRFTIYKKGQKQPFRKNVLKGKMHTNFEFITYASKKITLKDSGTYYIKVSKADKKTNGGYKIRVK